MVNCSACNRQLDTVLGATNTYTKLGYTMVITLIADTPHLDPNMYVGNLGVRMKEESPIWLRAQRITRTQGASPWKHSGTCAQIGQQIS